MTRGRRGFTMIELLIVVVLGALILAATLQVLITNQRIYTAQNSQIQGTQSMRAALAVLSTELREISPPGGDLLRMDNDTVRIRAQRAIGVVCHDTVLGVPTFRAFLIGDTIFSGDSVSVFLDNNSLKSWDDVWVTTTVAAASYGTSCGPASNPTQTLTLTDGAAFAADSLSSGAEIRAFTQIAYGLIQTGGDFYLGQNVAGAGWQPVVGPLMDNRGLLFEYLDETGTVTTTATEVAMIVVTVRTGGDVLQETGTFVQDSVTVRIHTRN
jgi:prepilin-type N-terminal cleavage/methylation domain-containing protein